MSNRALVVLFSVVSVLLAVPAELALAACWTTEIVTEPAQPCAPCNDGCSGSMRAQIRWRKCAVAPTNVPGTSECNISGNIISHVGYTYGCTQSISISGLAGFVGTWEVCAVACLMAETGIAIAGCVSCLVGWTGYGAHGGICAISTPCARDDDYKIAIWKPYPELGGNACQVGGE